MKFTFSKYERLCSQKQIGLLFSEGKSLYHFPFRLVYTINKIDETALSPVRIVISVPKRNFKKAVSRNLIKRRIREAYRKRKPLFYAAIAKCYTINLMLIYVSPKTAPYAEIETKLIAALNSLAKSIEKDTNIPIHHIN